MSAPLIRASSITVTPLCRYRVGPSEACGQVSVTTLAYACRHEHVQRHPTCQEHADREMADGQQSRVLCDDCYEAPAPHAHRCPLLVREETGPTGMFISPAAAIFTLTAGPDL